MRTFSFLLFALLFLVATSFAQWTRLNSGTDASFRGVSAVDANVCWVSGSKGTVLRTTDGGTHWTRLPVPDADKLDFRDVEAFSADTAIIMSSGPAEQGAAKIFKTTDAGAHWKQVFSTERKGIFLDSMAFWDPKHGIAFSDPVDGYFVLFTTEDGGDKWKELRPRSMPPALPNEGAFAASGTAIAVAGKHDVWFGTGGASVARVFHSPDSGKHWWVSETPIAAGKASAGVFGVAFKDREHGIAVGGDYTKLKDKVSAIATTKDGGLSWTAYPKTMLPLEGAIYRSGTFYAIGSVFARNDSQADAWLTYENISGNSLSFACNNRRCAIYVVGPRGEIRRQAFESGD